MNMTDEALKLELRLTIEDIAQRETVLAEILLVVYRLTEAGADPTFMEDRQRRVEAEINAAIIYRDALSRRLLENGDLARSSVTVRLS